jgi:hypothetical protein
MVADGVIENSDIHNCGAPPNRNLDDPNPGEHALYISRGLRTVIRHNLIHENGTRGVQIRNVTDNSDVYGNIIDTNGNAVMLDDPDVTGNQIHNNVLTRSENGVGSNTDFLPDAGPGNKYENNCVWSPPAANGSSFNGGNVTFANNYNAPANPYGTWPAITDATCYGKLPADSPFRPASR